MAMLKRLKFAVQSEAFHAGQKSLLDETIDTDLESLSQEIERLASPSTKEREKKQPERVPLPAHLPRKEIRHEAGPIPGCAFTTAIRTGSTDGLLLAGSVAPGSAGT